MAVCRCILELSHFWLCRRSEASTAARNFHRPWLLWKHKRCTKLECPRQAPRRSQGLESGCNIRPKFEHRMSTWLWKNAVSLAQDNSFCGFGSPPNNVKTVFQLWPRFTAAANRSTSRTVLHASTPEYIFVNQKFLAWQKLLTMIK